jgi:hypothetical protein
MEFLGGGKSLDGILAIMVGMFLRGGRWFLEQLNIALCSW